ncbi:MAG: hypothetical protein WAK76_31500, partial [Trebonia sp.]
SPVTAQAANVPLTPALADDAESFVTSRLPPPRAAVSASEKVLHGLAEIAEGLLLYRLASASQPHVISAGLRELPALF